MKATQANFAATLPRAVEAASVFFLCGADEAGVQDAAALIVAQLPDSGERVELSGADLRRDPGAAGRRGAIDLVVRGCAAHPGARGRRRGA